jgi:hypothetical protein
VFVPKRMAARLTLIWGTVHEERRTSAQLQQRKRSSDAHASDRPTTLAAYGLTELNRPRSSATGGRCHSSVSHVVTGPHYERIGYGRADRARSRRQDLLVFLYSTRRYITVLKGGFRGCRIVLQYISTQHTHCLVALPGEPGQSATG